MFSMLRRFLLTLSLISTSMSSPLEKPIAIGASVTSGLEITELTRVWGHPKSDNLAFDLALEKLLHGETRIPNTGNRYCFFAIEKMGHLQVNRALKYKPSAVFAIDFLFWYVYGHFQGEGVNARLARLERGLAELARFDCPLILGDIPDVQGAIHKVLSPSQVPRPDVLKSANRRIREWAAQRPKVRILSLSYFMEKVQAKEEIEIPPVKLTKDQTLLLLQRDQLHPTQAGVDLLAKVSLALLREIE